MLRHLILGTFLFATLFIIDFQQTYSQASNAPQVQCGDIVEGEFIEDYEEHYYKISLVQGDELNLEVISLEREGVLLTSLIVDEPNSTNGYYTSRGPFVSPVIQTGILTTRGDFTIRVVNSAVVSQQSGKRPTGERGGAGRYNLFIGCVTRDGTVINPGENVPTTVDIPDTTTAPTSSFSGFGFPGIVARDFTGGIEVPISFGTPIAVPVGGDIGLYTFRALAGASHNLVVIRSGGDISIGVTVINKDTNEIIFIGGMPYTNALVATLNIPIEGTYAIGLFRLDTPTRQGTSGAVQLSIE